MSIDLLEVSAAPEPMTKRVRLWFGAGLVLLCIAISSAVVLLWPVPRVDLEALRREKAAADAAVAANRAALLRASPGQRGEAMAAESAAAADAAARAAALHQAEDQYVAIGGGRASMPRDLNLLILTLALGALGAFLHAAKSFAGYAGNRSLAASWTWWYVLQPFVGSTLALLFYLVIRGGLFANGAPPSAINPYGVGAVSGLVGMFSKQASDKLGELFSTLFHTGADAARKDKLN
ncbi:MAG TPA: hypothetical protein VGF59_14335 [Bryobacteraceae bacterium]